jgi:glycosyltransferase involved in cell wall biosynthesis
MKNNEKCEVSIVVPSYNREEELVHTLECILNQECDFNYEIILIDQTKDHNNNTKLFLDSIKNRVNYIFQETPSITVARNIGIKNSKGDLIIFIDDDITCDKNFINHHYETYKQGYDVIQGRIIEDDGENDIDTKPLWLYPWIKYKGSNNCEIKAKTNVITGCNFSISRKVVDKVGYFDERFQKISIREDTDYGYRSYKAGLRMIFEPKALVFHHRSSGGVETGIKNHYFDNSYYYCEFLFAKKHFNKIFRFVYFLRLYIIAKRKLYKLILFNFKQK